MYLLGSNNIVQVCEKYHPNNQIQVFSDYSFSNTTQYNFLDMAINPTETEMILTSYKATTLEHLLFSITPSGIGPLVNITGSYSISTPDKIFVKGNHIYTYIKGSGPNNDSFYIVNKIDNSSSTIVLTTKGCSIAVP